MPRAERIELISAIERKRKSRVITYLTSDRHGLQTQISSDVIPVIQRHLVAIAASKTNRLDLLVYSRGGDANVPWALVSLIREYLGDREFSVLIPFRAHSAATVIALGADEIVMGPSGELGPIDATINRGPHNPREEKSRDILPISVEDAMGYFTLLHQVGLEDLTQKMQAFNTLSSKVHPLALGSVSRLLEQTKLVAKQLLDNRRPPLSTAENEQIVKRLSSEIYSHDHTIRCTEAKNLGLTYVKSAKEAGIERPMAALFEEYVRFFDMRSHFSPNDDLISNDLSEKEWKGVRLACVEAKERLDICTIDLRVRQLKEVPPTVNFNLPNLRLAIPPVPDGADANQIQTFINQAVTPIVQAQVEAALQAAKDKLVKALPRKGFEHVQLNAGWRTDGTGE